MTAIPLLQVTQYYEAGKDLIDSFMVTLIISLKAEMFTLTNIFVSEAKIILGIMMLFYLSVKAFQLMTGDAKLTLIPLLRPFIFFIIVVSWTQFLVVMDAPLKLFENKAQATFNHKRNLTNTQFELYKTNRIKLAKQVFSKSEDFVIDFDYKDLFTAVGLADEEAKKALKEKVATAIFIVSSRIQYMFGIITVDAITFVYKGCIYFLYFIQILLFTILRIIGPVIFALSVIPAYRDLYLQWISKYVSVGFYVVFAYIAMILSFMLILFVLKIENEWLGAQLVRANADVGSLEIKEFLQLLSQPVAIFGILPVALITGILGLLSVPVISTWVLGSNATSAVTNSSLSTIGNVANQAMRPSRN